MSDLWGQANPLGYFFAGKEADVPQALRQKIALAMLMQKKSYPKNLGEGLASIGDSIGQALMARSLQSEAAGTEARTGAAEQDFIKNQPLAAAPIAPLAQQVAATQPGNIVPPERFLGPPLQPTPSPEPEGSQVTRLTDPAAIQDWRQRTPPVGIPTRPPPTRTMAPPPPPTPAGLTPPPPDAAAPGGFPADRFNAYKATATTPAPGAPVMAAGADFPREQGAEALKAAVAARGGYPSQMGVAPSPPAGPPPAAPPQAAVNPGIRAAPPAAPIRQAPSPQQTAQAPEAGYVTPLPPQRQPPPVVTDNMTKIQNIIRNTPASDRDSMKLRMEPYLEVERKKLADVHEEYKSQLIQDRALELQHHKDRAAAAGDVANVAKINEEIAALRVPKIQKLEGDEYERNKVTGVYEPVRTSDAGTARPKVKLTAEQQKAMTFHGWTSLAEEQMQGKENLLSEGIAQELAGKIPFVGNKVQSAEYRRVRGAAERFVQGFLRDISGAVVGPEEIAKHMNSFLPKYGDKAADIADKKERGTRLSMAFTERRGLPVRRLSSSTRRNARKNKPSRPRRPPSLTGKWKARTKTKSTKRTASSAGGMVLTGRKQVASDEWEPVGEADGDGWLGTAKNVLQTTDDAVRAAANAVTFGGADRLAGAMGGLTSGKGYGAGVDEEVALSEAARKRSPYASIAGDVTGAVALPGFGAARLAARYGGGALARALAYGGTGAATGAAQGAGTTYTGNPEDYLKNAVLGGAIGAPLGAAGGAIFGRRPAVSAARTPQRGRTGCRHRRSLRCSPDVTGKVYAKFICRPRARHRAGITQAGSSQRAHNRRRQPRHIPRHSADARPSYRNRSGNRRTQTYKSGRR